MSKIPTTTIEFLHHLYSYISPAEGTDYDTLKQCIEKLFNANVRILEIVETLRPHKDDVIFALIEALNLPKNKTFFLHKNTFYVLEQIGDHDTVLLVMDKFDDYIELFDFSLTKLLSVIAAREGKKTEELILKKYVDFLIYVDTLPERRRQHKTSSKVISILSSLKSMSILNDARLPSILEKYIKEIGTRWESDLVVYNLALFVLAKIDIKKANEIITKDTNPLLDFPTSNLQHSRVVYNQTGIYKNSTFITVFVKNQEDSPFEETPYLFEYDKPLLLFLKNGMQNYKFASLVGREENQNNATRAAQKYIKKNIPKWQPLKNEFQEYLGILARHINFENWGFQQSYIEPGEYPTFIYDSKWCRVKFSFEGSGDQHDHNTYLNVYYGRLHAPNNDWVMLLNKEEHRCWHDDRIVLNFIDELSPEESIKQKYHPRVIDEYIKSDLAASLYKLSPAERSVGMVAHIWKAYGTRLFEVFDLRNPSLWKRFRAFVDEMYAIEKPNSHGTPAYNKIN